MQNSPSSRVAWLTGNAVICAALAADCLYDTNLTSGDKEPITSGRFREELVLFIKSNVARSQLENLEAVVKRCLE